MKQFPLIPPFPHAWLSMAAWRRKSPAAISVLDPATVTAFASEVQIGLSIPSLAVSVPEGVSR